MADGTISFDTTLNNKQAEAELNRIRRKIQKLTDDIYINEQKKIPLLEQAQRLGAELDAAKAKMYEMQNASPGTFSVDAIAGQKDIVRGLQQEWNGVNTSIERCDRNINNAKLSLDRSNQHAEQLKTHIKDTADQAKHADTGFDKLSKRLLGLAKRVFIFSVITSALRSVRKHLGEMIMQNADAQRSVAQLRGAMLTLAQPIVNAVIPAFVWLVNTITRVVAAIASLVSSIFGTTAKASADAAKRLNQQAGGYGNVAKEAEKARKEVMGFDELNIIGNDNEDSGSSGGGVSSGVQPDFSLFDGSDQVQSEMDRLLTYISGAALAVGALLCFTGVNIPLGLALMAIGALGLAAEVYVNWGSMDENLRGTLARTTVIVGGFLLVLGALLCFSGANIPLGIAMLALGAASMATAATLAWGSVDNAVKADVFSIMAAVSSALLVLGIILTFSGNLPLGIALIAAGAAGLVTVTALNWNAIKDWCANVWQSVKNWWNSSVAPVFTIAWWTNKLSSIGDGLKTSIKNGINGAIANLNRFISWANSALHIQWDGLSAFGQTIIPPGSIQLATIQTIPYLAQGAVIPPNREFMAVLGDQKHGTNIEAPLDTIKQAVAEVMNSGEMISLLREIAYSNQVISEKNTDVLLDGRSVAASVTKYQRNTERAMG